MYQHLKLLIYSTVRIVLSKVLFQRIFSAKVSSIVYMWILLASSYYIHLCSSCLLSFHQYCSNWYKWYMYEYLEIAIYLTVRIALSYSKVTVHFEYKVSSTVLSHSKSPNRWYSLNRRDRTQYKIYPLMYTTKRWNKDMGTKTLHEPQWIGRKMDFYWAQERHTPGSMWWII